MVLYIILFILSIVIPAVLNMIFSNLPIWYDWVASISIFAIIFGLDALIAWILHAMDSKYFDYNKKMFIVSKKEQKFLDILRVKDWKDHIPEMGQLCDFKKNHIYSYEPEYLNKFLVETVYAEVIHVGMALIGFLVIFIWPLIICIFTKSYDFSDILRFTLPMSLINVFLNLPPILIQRYNRPRLMVLYKYSIRHKKA